MMVFFGVRSITSTGSIKAGGRDAGGIGMKISSSIITRLAFLNFFLRWSSMKRSFVMLMNFLFLICLKAAINSSLRHGESKLS